MFAGYTRLEDDIVDGFRDKTAQDADMKLAYTQIATMILFEVGTAKQTTDALGKTIEPLALVKNAVAAGA